MAEVNLIVEAGMIKTIVAFFVMNTRSPYSVILRRDWLHAMQVVPSIYHQKLIFMTITGKYLVPSSQDFSNESVLSTNPKTEKELPGVSGREFKTEVVEFLEEINLGTNDEDKINFIGKYLSQDENQEMLEMLKQNIDIFACKMSDMPGIYPFIACHSLNIDPSFRPVKQKEREIKNKLYTAVNADIDRMLEEKIIRECRLSNIIAVMKKNGKVRVCIDFTNLKRDYPKDEFPLPDMDRLAESTQGYGRLFFMDGYSEYNLIPINPTSEERTSFITDRGLYCFNFKAML
ncbi:uncharacterized protein LOC113291005 [Papaver somniferum]|uniref:uncharacterized protein LOC113291005 n=1 Tax=Papaver somniferum TaxID=3469 RepID=UPI000E700235|nr:uncharacterized protein LOC113291005 [Papaver somniferum]